jgi:hypothetical protein
MIGIEEILDAGAFARLGAVVVFLLNFDEDGGAIAPEGLAQPFEYFCFVAFTSILRSVMGGRWLAAKKSSPRTTWTEMLSEEALSGRLLPSVPVP